MDISRRTTTYQVEDRSWLSGRHGADMTDTITLDPSLFTANTHYPNGYLPSGLVLGRVTATGLYGPYSGQAAEVQTVTITGAPTGGTFTLTFGSQTTAAIAYNATAATVTAALVGLAALEPADVTVTGAAGGPWTVTFGGRHAGDVPQLTATASLTGGTSPAVTIATTTAGGSAVTSGLQVAAGLLFDSVTVPTTSGVKVGGALFVHGVVTVANLPAASGLDQAARNTLSMIRFR